MEHDILAMWIQAAQVVVTLGIGLGQIGIIGWGLRRMRLAAEERNQQLDIMASAQRDQGQALRDIGQALRDQSQALQDQGQALQDQGQALRDQGQALRDQGQVLAELLRRTT